MTVLTEGLHAGEFLVSEANHSRSREQITVLSGQNLLAGAVLGRGGNAQAASPIPTVTGGTGTGTMTKLRFGPDVQAGSYLVKCITAVTNGGVFSVTAPDGTVLDNFTMTPGSGGTTAYASSHLSFSITDATDFIVNNLFTVVVTLAGAPVPVGTGNGAVSAVSLGPDAQLGTYRMECTAVEAHGGTFSVTAPDGSALQPFVMTAGSGLATAYLSSHINFTVTDATDFVAGDYFNLIVVGGADKAAAWSPAATDGTQNVAGILWAAVDATLGDVLGALIARDAEVNWSELSWAAGISAAEKVSARSALAALGIIGR